MRPDEQDVKLISINMEHISNRRGIPFVELEVFNDRQRAVSADTPLAIRVDRYRSKIFVFNEYKDGYHKERRFALDKDAQEIVDLFSSDIRRELNLQIDRVKEELRMEKSKPCYIKIMDCVKKKLQFVKKYTI